MHKLLGAVNRDGETHFRVWAPAAQQVAVMVDDTVALTLTPDADGYFVGTSRELGLGALYKYCVDGAGPWPDPCSRFQPRGPHGPSQVTRADGFAWTDGDWQGVRMKGQVIYELHIGTFTPEGTFDAAARRLNFLRDLGVTVIEVMPVAECPGRFNWGYDGVQLFAPYSAYGDYEALKRFVDCAHAQRLAVILDLVYNHLGPDGNYLGCFSPHYSTTRYRTDWGAALNFDGEAAHGVREFIIANGRYWIDEFHLDGFRLDATHAIFDASERHVLEELISEARAVAHPRDIICIAEDEAQRSRNFAPREQGGYDLDGLWNDDYHHAARVALTGQNDAYFRGYTGRAQELVSAVKRGFLYQGQYDAVARKPRGSSARRAHAWNYVTFLQNHDQVGHTFRGDRLHTFVPAGQYRALTALTLLAPQTPLLFMGQEFLATTRFPYFVDHDAELAPLVRDGRRDFMKQFAACSTPDTLAQVPDPGATSTFDGAKLDWREAESNTAALAFHRDLIAMRAADAVISRQDVATIDGATLTTRAFVVRWFDDAEDDRLLVVNLGDALPLEPAPEPLLAPPHGREWALMWSSEDEKYGGRGKAPALSSSATWTLPAESALLLQAMRHRPTG